ncbi:Fibrillarin-like protein [Spironucleus salmonicida]|uniref:rRNA 2'-O-methyltransferase fibrillarin n=1 Tax=Spironucleus salmonicida TaxID=348837 RepID=V6LQL9_9EUKA|nr:Fibrillarin-like protein [Spironucleus salmonicida]|eukprot:EST46543.1 Fibrillarin-like protein [Spironucleus salmonicida]
MAFGDKFQGNDRGGDRRGSDSRDNRGPPRNNDRFSGDKNGGDRNGGDRFGGDRNGGQRRDFKPRDGDRNGPPRGGDRNGPPSRGPPRQSGGSRVVIEEYKTYPGLFLSRGKTDVLVTKSMAPGISVYGEKRIQAEVGTDKIEYREWNPFRSKLGAAILCQVSYMPLKPGSKVLYLGAANGTTVSHVSDIVGPTGAVYAVEFSKRSGRDLLEMSKNRSNVFPIIGDARHPWKYRMVVPEVDAIFSDVAQADQARIVIDNAKFFLKLGGGMMISIKASSVDSTSAPEVIFAQESNVLVEGGFKVDKHLSIDEFHKNHAIIVGKYKK